MMKCKKDKVCISMIRLLYWRDFLDAYYTIPRINRGPQLKGFFGCPLYHTKNCQGTTTLARAAFSPSSLYHTKDRQGAKIQLTSPLEVPQLPHRSLHTTFEAEPPQPFDQKVCFFYPNCSYGTTSADCSVLSGR